MDTTVTLTDYPFFDGTIMTKDQTLLDQLATTYAKQQGKQPLTMTRFLFGDAPVILFDEIFAPKDPTELPTGGYLWLFHLSGYYGGLWLRGELASSGHNQAISGFSIPPTQETFAQEVSTAADALTAARGEPAAVRAYNEASLYDTPNPDNPSTPTRGLIDTFGYNEGYLLQIVEKPPEGLTTPPGFVECPAHAADGPLSCTYATSRLVALGTFDPVAAKLAAGEGAYENLARKIAPIQDAGVARGRAVWDGLLNVTGFSQEAYEQLLDISSAFLETVQATVLATVEGVAGASPSAGRQAATANAMMGVWLSSYIMGLTDGTPGRALPQFTSH